MSILDTIADMIRTAGIIVVIVIVALLILSIWGNSSFPKGSFPSIGYMCPACKKGTIIAEVRYEGGGKSSTIRKQGDLDEHVSSITANSILYKCTSCRAAKSVSLISSDNN